MRLILRTVFGLCCVAGLVSAQDLFVHVQAQAYSCMSDNDCLFNQYCDMTTTYACQPCQDCSVYNRYTGYAQCVRNIISDCGPCKDGYTQVNEYFTNNQVATCSYSGAGHLFASMDRVIVSAVMINLAISTITVRAYLS